MVRFSNKKDYITNVDEEVMEWEMKQMYTYSAYYFLCCSFCCPNCSDLYFFL